MLGERIRKLRKQKKMTLEALAGKELTKGMLSLIENNKANPSMESLHYIAEQLEVDLSELLEEISSQELREVLDQAEKLYNAKDRDHKQLIELIKPYVKKLNQGYEAARLLEIYSYSLYHEEILNWDDYLGRAATMFDQMNISSNRVAIGKFRATRKLTELGYEKALEIFLHERKDIEAHHAYIDPMTKLELDYQEAVFYFAVGNSAAALTAMERALDFSKEKRIFYLINDLYRLAAAQALLTNDESKTEYYTIKLQQYGEFADHLPSIVFCKLMRIMSLITLKKDYQKALHELNKEDDEELTLLEPWFDLEKGKVQYYLGHYELALKAFDKVIIPKDIYHPFDLSIFYVMDAYQALTYYKMGKTEDALAFAKSAVFKFEKLPDTSFKNFSLKAYKTIVDSI
jgi:transcriptional regulator with XRE-family HTH domain